MTSKERTTSAIEDKVTDTIENVSEAAKVAEEALLGGVKRSAKLIKKYPLESALVLFGVGIVAGMLLKNRN